jgi:hypothetical protein
MERMLFVGLGKILKTNSPFLFCPIVEELTFKTELEPGEIKKVFIEAG